jgi:hypothetical protein
MERGSGCAGPERMPGVFCVPVEEDPPPFLALRLLLAAETGRKGL